MYVEPVLIKRRLSLGHRLLMPVLAGRGENGLGVGAGGVRVNDVVSKRASTLSALERHHRINLAARRARRFTDSRLRLHRKGFDLKLISELLGHATLSATKRPIDGDPVELAAIAAGIV